jgi:hypothetical protein
MEGKWKTGKKGKTWKTWETWKTRRSSRRADGFFAALRMTV